MPSAGFPANLHSSMGCISVKSFTQAQASVSFIHQGKILMLLHVLEILIGNSPDLISTNAQSIVLCHS
jgi:hypothetical protein